jgi:hypothetical protein
MTITTHAMTSATASSASPDRNEARALADQSAASAAALRAASVTRRPGTAMEGAVRPVGIDDTSSAASTHDYAR